MMPETRKDAPPTMVEELLARCAALESEVARLEKENQRLRTVVSNETHELCLTCDELEKDRDASRALLREVADASGKAAEYLDFIARIAGDLEWGQRRRALRVAEELREVLRRAEAEALEKANG